MTWLAAIDLRRTPAGLYVCCLSVSAVALVYGLAAYGSWPTLSFSVDSWSLVELAHSFERHTPYAFNTYRSYATDDYSASFPFGYPFLLFLFRLATGGADTAGILINLLAAAGTVLVLVKVSRELSGSDLPGWVAGTALLTFVPYVDEVFGARTIPVALFALVCAGSAAHSHGVSRQASSALMSGVWAGLACLVRFDAIVFAALLGTLTVARTRSARTAFGYGAAALLTMSPWIAFSVTHFGHLWFSDNSWVAMSAVPAYVLDFPARASATLWTSPLTWFHKVAVNVAPLVTSLGVAAIRFPAPLLLLAAGLWYRAHGNRAPEEKGLIGGLPAVAFVSSLQLLSVGYFDVRYWTLPLCLTSLVLALSVWDMRSRAGHEPLVLFAVVIVAGAVPALRSGVILNSERTAAMERASLEDAKLQALHSCHTAEPQVTYVMLSRPSATRYGALYGDKVALLPSNWYRLSPATGAEFVHRMQPVRFIDADAVTTSAVHARCPR